MSPGKEWRCSSRQHSVVCFSDGGTLCRSKLEVGV